MFVLSFQAGFEEKQTSMCVPICAGSDCVTVNQDQMDFKTAEEACRGSMGELLTFQSETDEDIYYSLSQELFGDFWIGLRLPAGACTNLSAPLRGYEWTYGNVGRSFIPPQSTWKESVTLCSPHCVSLSNDHKWTERPCSDKINGFLCKTKHKHACQAQELSDPIVFKSSKGCQTGPCEHICKDVKDGYICSCSPGYIPDSKNPRLCQMYCGQEKCPVICEGVHGSECSCPNGYIRSENQCEDINECEMNACDQECINTFGSFVCSCRTGFVLKGQVKCKVRIDDSPDVPITSTVAVGFVKPANRNNTLKGSVGTGGSFVWIWIAVAVTVVVSIFVIRLYVVKRQKRREQHVNQSTTPVDNIEY